IDRDAVAARSGDHDLRALGRGPPRRDPARDGRSRAAARRADSGQAPPRSARGAARDLRTGDRSPLQPDLATELRPRHRLLPPRLLHDEAQPAAERAGGRTSGPRPAASGSGAEAGTRRTRPDVAPAALARRDLRSSPREPPAVGGLAW